MQTTTPRYARRADLGDDEAPPASSHRAAPHPHACLPPWRSCIRPRTTGAPGTTCGTQRALSIRTFRRAALGVSRGKSGPPLHERQRRDREHAGGRARHGDLAREVVPADVPRHTRHSEPAAHAESKRNDVSPIRRQPGRARFRARNVTKPPRSSLRCYRDCADARTRTLGGPRASTETSTPGARTIIPIDAVISTIVPTGGSARWSMRKNDLRKISSTACKACA